MSYGVQGPTMISANKQRQQEWDFVKAILIVFVVWGHVCSYISNATYEKNLLTSIIRLYQMPMFILVSGYFTKPSGSLNDVKKSFSKICTGNLIPYASWCIIGTLVVIGMNEILLGRIWGGISYVVRTIAQESNILWFLGCLILCRGYYAIVSWLSAKTWRGFYVLSLLLVLFMPVDIWHFNFLYPFFILGFALRKVKLKSWISPKWLIVWAVTALIMLIGSQFVPTSYTFYNASNYIFERGIVGIGHQLGFIIARYFVYGLVTICYLMLFINVYEFMKANPFVNKVCNLGQETLGIFLIHIILLYHVFRPFLSYVTSNEGILPDTPFLRYYIVGSMIAVIALMISLTITKLLERNKITRIVLLGKKV